MFIIVVINALSDCNYVSWLCNLNSIYILSVFVSLSLPVSVSVSHSHWWRWYSVHTVYMYITFKQSSACKPLYYNVLYMVLSAYIYIYI